MGYRMRCEQHNVDLRPGTSRPEIYFDGPDGAWWIDLSEWSCPLGGMYIDPDTGEEYGCDNTWTQTPEELITTAPHVDIVLEVLEDAMSRGLTPETESAVEQVMEILNQIRHVTS